ncbi:MAG: GerMN domain-containing protein [Oscillospiraceae bacterium]|nr:GerMN domain-containing protein [Oscillospiraceae bacterium]
MKRACLLLCCALILQILSGCGKKDDDFELPVNFYYSNKEIAYNSQTGVIQAEKREGQSFHGNVTALLHAYLLGPHSDELYSPIPKDVYLVSCQIENDAAYIVLSAQFSKLSGIGLTTGCSAILMTLHDYAGVNDLVIRAKDSQLDGKDTLELSTDSIVLIDTVSNEQSELE